MNREAVFLFFEIPADLFEVGFKDRLIGEPAVAVEMDDGVQAGVFRMNVFDTLGKTVVYLFNILINFYKPL